MVRHRRLQRPGPGRRGAVSVYLIVSLPALLLAVLVGINAGYLVEARTTLENSADAAALAGAQGLVDDRTLLDDPEQILKGLRLFRFKGNDVIVFHILDQAELDLPFDGNILFEDLEEANLKVVADPRSIRNTYREVVQEFINEMRKQCHDSSIDYQLISTSTPLDQALASYLSWRG